MSSVGLSYLAVNQNIMDMEYAVRGPIPQRAADLKKQGMETIPCNIGNPQALGQKPMAFYRQIISLVEDPGKIDRERRFNAIAAEGTDALSLFKKSDFISDYSLDLSEQFLSKMPGGLGAYVESNGPLFIREAIAAFIDKRDGLDVPSKPADIFLTNGASEGAGHIIDLLIAKKNDGIMVPIPQYPLYSATIKKCGGVQVNYYPEEDEGWSLNTAILEDALHAAQKDGVNVKGIVVINPGNPTGAVLAEETIAEIIAFARQNNLVIIADEVYQENVYEGEFVSFAKVLGDELVPLFSLHSVSKGFYGECGHRGGYFEVRNPPKITGTEVSLTEVLLKQASVGLCANTVGQLLVYLMVNPPEENSEPYQDFIEEKRSILQALYEKAAMIREGFSRMNGVECFGRTGAMYLFPRLTLPAGSTDFDYCMRLLEETGLCTVNGAGFGQKKDTHHLRIAFLPPKSLIEKVMPEWVDFHNRYVHGV